MFELGNAPNAIRALFAYGCKRKAEIGDDKVFDFSLGNPNIPAPDKVNQTILELLALPSDALHGYTPAQGTPGVRKAIAESINRRFGMAATADNLYMTVGAAASFLIAVSAISAAGDEFIVINPYFPEYLVWIEQAGCVAVEVAARKDDFQLDLGAIERALTSKTAGIIINSPNNPVGTVYSRESLEGLAQILNAHQERSGRVVTLISDEPYREIVYDGIEAPFIAAIYNNTIVCYSYSKSLSLAGERIGYLYVCERMTGADAVYTAVCGAGRALGFVCAPSMFQHVVERCVDVPADVVAYTENRAVLTEGLKRLGYEFVEPQGAFYLWVKALEPDAEAFSSRAKAHELLIVPSKSFGCDGWVRIGYCVNKKTIEDSMPAFEALMKEYRP